MTKERKKAKIVQLFKDETEPAPPINPSKIKLKVKGNNNVTAGRDVVQHINKKEITRPVIQPGPDAISSSQAKTIQGLVKDLVDRGVASGGESRKLYAYWWGRLKNQYDVSSYKEINAHLGDHAISWLKQQKAITRSKTRKPANNFWRNDIYKGIYARSRNLGISKGEILSITKDRLGKAIVSLKQLNDTNLKKLYNIIFGMKK